ncbi:hypothetical protein OK016_20205 [Vibrio chagasii]|nr:hypothetical protein [Vibrio chagasii]
MKMIIMVPSHMKFEGIACCQTYENGDFRGQDPRPGINVPIGEKGVPLGICRRFGLNICERRSRDAGLNKLI